MPLPPLDRPSDVAIAATGLGKCYELFDRPLDRLRHLLRPRAPHAGQAFWALRDVNFQIKPGEVVGLVGRNGAGKSTLLHLVSGTLTPSTGTLQVRGRVAALLELGSGFNPDFTGLENVYMNAAILGLERAEVEAKLDDILGFADIGTFIDHPVKTYSSGMFMRLAFAVATSVDPDILIIDEALAVGDGAFARKSFDRIMKLKESGKTIVFCSHSMYQIEALCTRALWLDAGSVRAQGSAADVTSAYNTFLCEQDAPAPTRNAPPPSSSVPAGTGMLTRVTAHTRHGSSGTTVSLVSGQDDLHITLQFAVDPQLPTPTVAIGLSDASGLTVASAGSLNDGCRLTMSADGIGQATLVFPKFPLLKGRYHVTGFLASEDGVHVYDQATHCLTLHVTQHGLEQGLVSLPHQWLA